MLKHLRAADGHDEYIMACESQAVRDFWHLTINRFLSAANRGFVYDWYLLYWHPLIMNWIYHIYVRFGIKPFKATHLRHFSKIMNAISLNNATMHFFAITLRSARASTSALAVLSVNAANTFSTKRSTRKIRPTLALRGMWPSRAVRRTTVTSPHWPRPRSCRQRHQAPFHTV